MTQEALFSKRLLSDPDFPQLKSYIIRSTGLAYFLQKDEDLAGRIARRLQILGWMDCDTYRMLLGTSMAPGSEFDSLVNVITIGETFFFRHNEQFDALRTVVLPKLMEKNAAKRTLRIWCAGCSSGAEPYTLSIILRHEFRVMLAGWTIEILGTDINSAALKRAQDGEFDDWHLRSVKDQIKSICFKRGPGDRGWLINDEYKKNMSFQHHNLISGRYPPQLDVLDGYDIIFCRNVMIYFSPETVSTIMPRFDQCLKTAGYMFLGYSEINTDLYRAFESISYPGALLFRKRGDSGSSTGFTDLHAPAAAIALPAPAPVPQATSVLRTIQPSAPASTSAPAKLENRYQICQGLADKGDYAGALAEADRLIANDSLDARAQFYRGTCLWQMDDLEAAELAFRRAIYIDRKFTLAHYQMALIFQRLGDTTKAFRYFNNAAELMQGMPGSSTVLPGDKITVEQLKHLIHTMKDAS